jgi:transcriptional regulator with XRE-family HTH domain
MRIELIESIRKKKGFTQAQMAKMINFSTTGYQKMIYVGDVKVSVLEQIAKIFGVDITIFFGKDANKSYNTIGTDPDMIADVHELYQRNTQFQKELLSCYKLISDLQEKLLVKTESSTRKNSKSKTAKPVSKRLKSKTNRKK